MTTSFFDKGKPFAILVLRLVAAWRLLAGTWPYVVGARPAQEVVDFFESLSMPAAALSAYVSLYAQFICGVFLGFGWRTQEAALIMFINFSVALPVAHLHDPIDRSFQAWALWAISIYFLFHGPGDFSIGKWIDRVNFSSPQSKVDE